MKPRKSLSFIFFINHYKVYKRLKFPFIFIFVAKFHISQWMPGIRHLFYIWLQCFVYPYHATMLFLLNKSHCVIGRLEYSFCFTQFRRTMSENALIRKLPIILMMTMYNKNLNIMKCSHFRGHPESMFVVEGGRGSSKSERKRTEGRGGQAFLSVRSVKKIVWFFKQQTEFLLVSFLSVPTRFLSLVQHEKVFFIKKAIIFFFI